MTLVCVLGILVIIALDLAALRWGDDSVDPLDSPEWEYRRNWPPVKPEDSGQGNALERV